MINVLKDKIALNKFAIESEFIQNFWFISESWFHEMQENNFLASEYEHQIHVINHPNFKCINIELLTVPKRNGENS